MHTLRPYLLGFILSLTLTSLAFGSVWLHQGSGHSFPTHPMLLVGFVCTAVLQLIVQLFFFLHVGKKGDSWWNVVVLGFAFFIITVLVGGTVWVMQHLTHHQQVPFIEGKIHVESEND